MIILLSFSALLCLSAFLNIFNLFECGEITSKVDYKLDKIYCKLFVAFVVNFVCLLICLLG